MQSLSSKLIIFCTIMLYVGEILAQTDNIELYDKQMQLINRLDIKLRGDSVLQFTTVKPFERKRVTERVERIDSLDKAGLLGNKLSKIDRYNIQQLLLNNSDWAIHTTFTPKKGIFNTFFQNPAHIFMVDKKNQYSLIVDPLMNVGMRYPFDATGKVSINQRGIRIRGQIDQRFGYYLYFSENQERVPQYVDDYVQAHRVLPGQGYFKNFSKGGYDYWDIRSGISFHVGKSVDFQLGHDKFFIGNGIRTTFLSDNSAAMPYVKLTAQAGKLKYTTAATQTIASFEPIYANKDTTRPRNYMMFHYLNWQATNWLNLGFFESTTFNSAINGGFQYGYLNPTMFNRAYSSYTGNASKSSIGLDFKANFAQQFQLYGQWLINEFHFNKVMKTNGPWVNKFGWQLGGKYVDVLGIKNLDLQVEGNLIRPFTYMDKWAQNNFMHYNQPLAHPLGANFKEVLTIAQYQPLKKWYLEASFLLFKKGLDTTTYHTAFTQLNYGGDLFRNYTDGREKEDGYAVGDGVAAIGAMLSLTASYELLENLFLDANAFYRKYDVAGKKAKTTKFISLGLRWNMPRRSFMW